MLGVLSWPVDVDTLVDRVQQPSELGAVVDLLLRLCLESLQAIAGRPKLDDEAGAQRSDFVLLKAETVELLVGHRNRAQIDMDDHAWPCCTSG